MSSSYRKKLIEVALPLEAINAESAREKSIRHGHPSTLHLWWARRPLAACRAVLWSSLVDDPSEYMPDEESAKRERERLFGILEELVQWENSNNEAVLDKARLEIARSVARDLNVDVPIGKQAIREFLATQAPPVLDPFAGGGSIPLEAQRLGLRAYASDLNPVAVLINKAQIELPAQFAGLPPVHILANNLRALAQTEEEQTNQSTSPSETTQEEQEQRFEIPDGLRRKMVELARQFRKTPTRSEERLWQALRNKQLDGVKFRRQQPIGPFVVDFFAPSLRLVVEVDGPIHRQQQEADRQRQQLLEAAGLRVFRLTADEVENHLPETLQKLHRLLTTLPASSSHPPSPLEGEGPGVRASSQESGVRASSQAPGERASSAANSNPQLPLWQKEWHGAQGLAEDVRYYGQWMRDQAQSRIGQLYPPVTLTADLLAERPDLQKQGLKPGDQLTVIAWLWTRTVTCPNPACRATMPLAHSFALSTKKGKEAWAQPLIQGNQVRFTVRTGAGKVPEGTVNRNGARCICCGMPVPLDHVRAEGKAGRMSAQMMAIVAEGKSGRIYLPPNPAHEKLATSAQPAWKPEQELQGKCRVSVPLYGMNSFSDLFTPRQLTALTTFSDLIGEVRQRVLQDAQTASRHLPSPPPPSPLEGEGPGERASSQSPGERAFPPSPLEGEGPGVRASFPQAYADAIATYLGMAVSRLSNRMSSLSFWDTVGEKTQQVFARQALPMIWDFVEANPICNSTGSFINGFEYICSNLQRLPSNVSAVVIQNEITKGLPDVTNPIISTDPPYYDNIGYADLSDYFYIWLRYCLRNIYTDLFSTLLVPKAEELVATPYRFNGNLREANIFFENGLHKALSNIKVACNHNYPVTIFYAYKQSEEKEEGRSSTGWEAFITSVIDVGLQIHGTWPMRTEQPGGLRVIGQNALASSIVLVCRPRPSDATTLTRRDFLAALKRELPAALRQLQQGNIAPVDLAQAAIGPGMAIFSRHAQVLEANGSPMSVRTALALINQALDEYLTEQEGEYDADTRWALAWFEQYGHEPGPYGVAETLSKAKNTSVEGLAQAGFLEARTGKVRLLRREELPQDWQPAQDKRLTAWEAAQYLIRALDKSGEQGSAALLTALGDAGEVARDLAYRLYTLCERKGWAADALLYNMLVIAWPRIKEQVGKGSRQQSLL